MYGTRPSTPCFLKGDSTASSVSDSFISLVGKHTVPRKYTELATSFICSELPFKNKLCLEDTSESEDLHASNPFPNPVPINPSEFSKKDKSIGQSIRSKHLIPNTRTILNEILHPPKLKSLEARTNYLYYKGKQWCEVNKALVVDQKYPKPDPDIVRSKYSTVHQEAIKLTREELEVEKHDSVSVPSSGKTDSVVKVPSSSPSPQYESAEGGSIPSVSFTARLKEIFGKFRTYLKFKLSLKRKT